MIRNSSIFRLSVGIVALVAMIAANLRLADAVTGKVVSCPAWTLNKHKELRMFLKGESRLGSKQKPVGEIDEYAGITIEWIRGRRAVLTIFDDNGTQLEDVKLYELKTRDEMHQLLVEKGFHKKTQEERLSEIREASLNKELRALEGPSGVYDQLTAMYFVIFVLIAAAGLFFHGKKRKKRFARAWRV